MPGENENFSPLTIQRVSVEVDPGAGILLCEIFIGQTNSPLQANFGLPESQ